MLTQTDTLLVSRTLIRDMPDRSRIVAQLEIHQIGGNAHPHFSATASVYEPHGTHSGASRHRRGLEEDCAGADHRAILDAFPGLAPFVALHLSDYPAGVPMHALANARYFTRPECAAYELQHYGAEYIARQGSPLERCARYLRCCTVDDLPQDLVRAVACDVPDLYTREDFAAFVDTLRPRWAREASAARALLESLPTLYQLRGYDWNGDPVHREPIPETITGETGGTWVDV